MIKSIGYRILSFVLLGVFTLAIIPAESFHHHDFQTVSCLESEHHIEQDQEECLLADFILPSFTLNAAENHQWIAKISAELIICGTFDRSFRYLRNPSSRAPPVV